MAESPGFTGLGAPSLPGFPVSPLPGECINSQPWLWALTHCVAPLMRGRPERRRRRARATGLSPPGPPWAGAEAAKPRGWGVALCATTALAGAVPRLCVRGARGRFGGFGPVPGVVSLSFPPPRPACSALRVAGRPFRVSLTLARWYAIPRGLWVPRARSGCPSGSPRVSLSCVCARALAVSAPPPLWVVWRAHLAWSRHWALVGPFHVVRAPPRVLPRSLAPSGVLGGGRSGPGSPLLGLGLWGWRQGVPGGGAFYRCEGRLGSCAPPPPTARPLGGLSGSAIHVLLARACRCGGPALSPRPARPVGAARRGAGPWRSCAGGRAGGGGGRAPYPPVVRPGGGPVGRGFALPHSVPLPSLGRQQSGCHWRCAVHGGRGPPYHSGSCSPGFRGYDLCGVLARRRGLACSSRPPWEPVAGAGGRVALRLLSRAGGGPSPLPRGVGAGAPAACGPVGGRGGGCRAAASLLPFWAAACGTPSWPPSCRRRAPFRRARAVGAEVPPRGGGG